MKKLLLYSLLVLISGPLLFAQTRTVQGKVTSAEDNSPLPGVNVVVTGTSRGAVTDSNGEYTLQLTDADNSLTFSFIGYMNLTIEVAGRTSIDVQLQTDVTALEEVVVVGYGTQKAKDLTSAISTVNAEDIVKTPNSQVMQSLQGRVPGVQIVSSGAPGSGPTVRIRGLGSFEGGSSPLYVVDGVWFDNIDFLNSSDVESVSVLKDASALSIFGVRAANGVILITTKSGAYGKKTEISYDGYYGVQRAQNVMKMANSAQFANYITNSGSSADQSYIDAAFQRFGRSRINPNVPNVNTDWYKEVLEKSAPIQSHSITLRGGTDKTKFSVGTSLFKQDGMMKITRNSYQRANFLARVDIAAADWLDVGANVNISNATQYVGENSVWFKTYFAVPILPVYDPLNATATDPLGNAKILGYRGSQNPYFDLYYNDNYNQIGKILGNFYFDAQLIPEKLRWRTAYNYSYQNTRNRNVDFEYFDGTDQHQSGISKTNSTTFNQIVDNTLTFTQDIGNHNITAMLGYSFRSETNDGVYVRGENFAIPPDRDYEELWYAGQGTINPASSGDFGTKLYGSSYFGRIAYNYSDRYLLYITLRRDGTSKFQGKFGTFPAIGAGWVISEENFFNVNFIDFLKLRASWGKIGNDNVTYSVGASTLNQVFTAIDDTRTPGYQVSYAYDIIDRWETTKETNIGLSSRFLNNRLSAEVDYFIRDTEDAVITVYLPLVRSQVRRAFGEIRNSGIEMAIDWNDNLTRDIHYSVGFNFGTLKNEVRGLGGQEYINAGTAEFRQRSILGQPMYAFYGYKVEGVFQNATEIANSGYTSEFITSSGVVPGDFKYKDQNGDGVIDDKDRVVLGSYLPKFSWGFNLSISYKNFDLSAFLQGQSGNKILNRKRGEIIFTNDTNIDADLATNLWTGEGSGNKYPSAAGIRKPWNQYMSDYFVESGSYFRIQNVRLSYHVPTKEVMGIPLPDTRISFTAERPLTVFNYNGFNPEVPDGVDRQTYPIPAVYTLGLNLKL